MKKGISVMLAAAMLLVVSMVWYSCKKEEITGSIYGTVTDFATGQPIGNVNVKLRPSGETALTGSDGSYEFKELEAGKYSLLLSKAEYADLDDDYVINVEAGKDVRRDVQIRKKIASLQITDMNGNPLDTLDFGADESVNVKTFNVFNNGTEKLSCSVNNECEWITSVTGLENEIPSGQTVPVTVRIDRVALVDGVNTTLLTITSGNGSNEIVVKATFLGAAVITTTQPTSVTANSATVGGNITDDGGRPVLARGICYGTSQTPTIDGDHTEDGSGTGSFSHNITGLSSSTTYYARAYATNRNGTYYASNIVSFTTANGLPTVITTNVTDVTASTAKSGGNVTNNGGYNVTARGVCWNTMGSPDLNDAHTTNGNGNGVFTSNITNLAIGTTYHVRAYATNSKGTSYGEEKTFTTPSGNVIITFSVPTNITSQSATCSANITDDGGVAIAMRGFCWGTTQYPTTAGDHIDLGMGSGSFTASITNLQASTTYYVRAFATNQAGTTYSEQHTFTTTNGLPTITTAAVSNVTAVSAVCGGTISDNGGFNVTARGVCWNTMGNPDLNGSHTTNGTGNGTFSANLSNLTPGTTYHVRAYATNSNGTVYGDDITFSTSNGNVTISLSSPTNITATSASCSANITDDGGATITERGICWGAAQYPTVSGSHAASGNGTGSYSVSMSGLTPSTTYYVRAYATNSAGTSYSSQQSFTTADGMPVVTTGIISNITATSATCSGNVTSDGGIVVTAKGFCWSTSQYPTIVGSHSNDGSGTGTYNGSLTNLSIGTTYYVRAYATNSTGTSYGEQVSFTTGNGLPSVTTTTPNLNGTTVTSGGNVTSDGGFTVTSRGICYGALPNPDLTSTYNHTTNGSGMGYYSSSFYLPNGSGTYYIRAYASNANGTVYGEQVTVIQPYDELPSFTYNGHTYKVAPEPDATMNWTNANAYCENLTFAGYSDWHMPTKDQMLAMCAVSDNINDLFGWYYSATPYNEQSYWIINVPNCNLSFHVTQSFSVRPIRMDN